MDSMDVLLETTVLLTLVLAFSLLIERFLEVLNSLLVWADSKSNRHIYWTKKTYELRDQLEKRMRLLEYVDDKTVASILNRFRKILLNDSGEYQGTVPVLSGNLLRAATIKIWCKLAGVALGIGIALWMKLDLLSLWQSASGSAVWKIYIPGKVCIVFSGIAIGLGSTPVHKIISSIEKKQAQKIKKGAVS